MVFPRLGSMFRIPFKSKFSSQPARKESTDSNRSDSSKFSLYSSSLRNLPALPKLGSSSKSCLQPVREEPEPPSLEPAGKSDIICHDGGRTSHSVHTVQDLKPNDIIIPVMGPTGTGKSTFIQKATGAEWGIGHSLHSHTSQVNAVRVDFSNGTSLVLVDTPGFDDTEKSDREILKIVANWLREVRQYQDSNRNKLEISGILYLHRITDNRMGGTPLKNLRLFRKLCGDDFLNRVCFTTTMWAESENDQWENAFQKRQAELEATFWAPMIAQGACTRRFRGTQISALEILQEVIATAADRKRHQILEIQKELVDLSKRLPATRAGKELHGIIEEMVVKQTDLLGRLQSEMNQTSDPQVLRELITELNDLRREREKALKDMRRLDLWATGMVGGFRVWISSWRNRLSQRAREGNGVTSLLFFVGRRVVGRTGGGII